MKKVSSIAIILLFAASLATTAWAENAMNRIKSEGVLKIGSTATGVPTTFLDPESKKIVGVMIDICQEIADSLGVKLEVIETPWTALIPSLQAQKIDLLAAAMVITPQRQEVIDFTIPVYPHCETIVVKAGETRQYKTVEDLRGVKVGAQAGTTNLKGLDDLGFKNVVAYDNNTDMMTEIMNGRIDVAIIDRPIAKWLVKSKPQLKVKVVDTYKPAFCAEVGIGVNKANKDLLEEVNKVLEKMEKEGRIQKILQKWGQ